MCLSTLQINSLGLNVGLRLVANMHLSKGRGSIVLSFALYHAFYSYSLPHDVDVGECLFCPRDPIRPDRNAGRVEEPCLVF
jgi:hypothetical protein